MENTCKVMSEHIETRRKIKSIYDIKTFNELLDNCVLTEEDKTIMTLHYLKGKDFRYIADELGFAESTIKHRHKKILSKLNHML